MANLNIKDTACLQVIMRPYTLDSMRALQRGGSIQDILGAARAFDDSSAVNIKGVFANDGAAVTIEGTTDEDEFIESVDGSVCVFPKSNKNRIMTLRLNSCNGVVEDLIRAKNFKLPTASGELLLRTSFYFHFCDLCSGYSLVSNCAYILSNPVLSFGQDDSPIEIRILLVDPKDNRLVFSDSYETRAQQVVQGATNGILGN